MRNFLLKSLTYNTNLQKNELKFSIILFPGRVVSRKGDFNWPPRSCDLTPLDFSLCGYVKNKMYADAPQSIQ